MLPFGINKRGTGFPKPHLSTAVQNRYHHSRT